MAATGYMRGHLIEFSGDKWLYKDTRSLADDSRACIKCNLAPTEEGFDPCIGFVKGAISVCCGHGVEPAYIKFGDKNEQL